MQYAINIKSGVWHYRDENATLCGWSNDHRREPCEYRRVDLCSECAAKLRKLCILYHAPMLKREGKDRFQRLPKSLLDGIRLEAAQKGYWGIL